MDILNAVLPWPPSANNYWRYMNGRVLVSKKARDYKKEVAWQSINWPVRDMQGRLSISIIAHEPDKRIRDLDNLLKISLDSLQSAAAFKNDSQIDKIIIERGAVVKNGELKISIQEYKQSKMSNSAIREK